MGGWHEGIFSSHKNAFCVAADGRCIRKDPKSVRKKLIQPEIVKQHPDAKNGEKVKKRERNLLC